MAIGLSSVDEPSRSPRRPLLGVAVLFTLGVWLGNHILIPVPALFAACGGFVAVFFLRQHAALLYAAIFSGGWLTMALATFESAAHLHRQLGDRRTNVWLRGVVVGTPVFEEWPDSHELAGRSKVELRLRMWREADGWRRAEGKVMAILPVERTAAPPAYGDELEVRATLERPAPPMNWGQFDYRRELERRRIFYVARVARPDDLVLRARRQGNPFIAAALESRAYLQRALRVGIEGEDQVTSLLDAMLLGIRHTVVTQRGATSFAERVERFQTSGTAHIFAISGLHVGLVAAALALLLRALSVRRIARTAVVIPVLMFYTLVTSARPSAVRALLMASALFLGWALKRPTDALNSIAAAAIATLIFNPLDLFGAGFQLSFAAVIAVVTLAPAPLERAREWMAPDPWIPPRSVPRWRRWIQEPLSWFAALACITSAAWLGTAPLMAYHFHLFAPIALLANLLVVPALTGMVALGLLAMASFAVWPALAELWNNANWLLVKTVAAVAETAGSVRGGHEFVRGPSALAVTLIYGAMILTASGWLLRARWRWICAAGSATVFALWALTMDYRRGRITQLTALHTNGGQAVFIAPPRRSGVLLDAGSEFAGRYIVLPFLRSQGQDALRAVMMSHGASAYIGGVLPILERMSVAMIYDTAAPSQSPTHRTLRALTRPQELERGNHISVGREVLIRVAHPQRGRFAPRAEDNCLVLMLESAGRRTLLMGAAGASVERALCAELPDNELRADVIVRGPHSREPTCTEEFLERVRPRVVVWSAGTWPPSSYPPAEELARLERRGIRAYRTDRDGAVRIWLRQEGVQIETFKPKGSVPRFFALPCLLSL